MSTLSSSSSTTSILGRRQALASDLEQHTSGDWVDLGPLAAIALVVSLVVAVFTYYLITDDFTTGGKYADLGWVSTGSGLMLLFLVVLFGGLVGTTLGYGFKNKSSSLMAAAGAAVLVGIVFYWACDAAHADRANQVMLWAALAVIGGAVLSFFGWKMAKELGEIKSDAVGADRAKFAMYTMIGSIIVGVVLLLAFWKIYEVVPAA